MVDQVYFASLFYRVVSKLFKSELISKSLGLLRQVVLTNQRWLRYNREQTAHVQLLLQRLRSAEEERKKLHDQLEATRSLVRSLFSFCFKL